MNFLAKIKRCVTYDRVSTQDQAYNKDGSLRNDASPEAQQKRCIDQINLSSKKDGIQRKIIKTISDKAKSGKNTKRSGYQELLRMIVNKEVDEIYATEISRLSRSVTDFLKLVELCESHNVAIIILGMNFDTTTAQGKLFATLVVALASFERELTSHRVRENALLNLVKNGKINGGGEILGLDRDNSKPGHFVINVNELKDVKEIFKLYKKWGTRAKVLELATAREIKGKHGKPLTDKSLEHMINNAEWRYRGLWPANRKNRDLDNNTLPAYQQYQIVNLPHGALIDDLELLDEVVRLNKIANYAKKQKSVDGFIYRLTSILVDSKGNKYAGQPAKSRSYRYYINKTRKQRVRCEEIEKRLMEGLKNVIFSDSQFSEMMERATIEREEQKPLVVSELEILRGKEQKLNAEVSEIVASLKTVTEGVSSSALLAILDERSAAINAQLQIIKAEREALSDILKKLDDKPNVSSLKMSLRKRLDGFNSLTSAEQRNCLESMVKFIEITDHNKVIVRLFDRELSISEAVTERKKSSAGKKIGVTNGA